MSVGDQVTVSDASPQGVVHHLARIRPHLRSGRWLGVRNVYRNSPVVRLEAEQNGRFRPHPQQLGDYVAASIPLHLWDGWTYLGMALSAQMGGMIDNAIHLGYYAELRAAMSLLATQGVGVFRNVHCIVKNTGEVATFRGPSTHAAVDKYLTAWTASAYSSNLVGQLLGFAGMSAQQWLSMFPRTQAWLPLGRDLLQTVGFDIAHMATDRYARNEASYRARGLADVAARDVDVDVEFLSTAILLLDPSTPHASFGRLDRHLIRRLLEDGYYASTGEAPASDATLYKSAIDYTVNALISDRGSRSELSDFLSRQAEAEEPSVLHYAHMLSTDATEDRLLPILGRAVVLLRIATGSAREILAEARVDLELLEFWWNDAGLEQGLWQLAPATEELPDIWEDFAIVVEALEAWRISGNGSRYQLLSENTAAMTQLMRLASLALLGLNS